MRAPKDRELASKVAGIDFVLGGHDHSYITEVDADTGVFVIKSGTDFEEFNDCQILLSATEEDYAIAKSEDSELVKHLFSPQKGILVRVEKVPITAQIPVDSRIEKHITANASELNRKMNEVCAYFDVDLEGRFEHLRYEETNVANFVADFILTEYENVDVVLLNSGTLRSNAIMPAGDFTLRMMHDLLPMSDKLI